MRDQIHADFVLVLGRDEWSAAAPGCFRSHTVFKTWSNVSWPGSTVAPAAKRRAKAFMYNSRTMPVADDLFVMNSAPFRSSACVMTSFLRVRAMKRTPCLNLVTQKYDIDSSGVGLYARSLAYALSRHALTILTILKMPTAPAPEHFCLRLLTTDCRN